MTSNNETVSRQNLWAGNIAKSMTSEGNNVVSCWQPLQQVWKKIAGNFNFKPLATEQIDQNFKIILRGAKRETVNVNNVSLYFQAESLRKCYYSISS